MIQKKLRAMFFWRDRKVVRVLHNLGIAHINFHAPWRARIFSYSPRDD